MGIKTGAMGPLPPPAAASSGTSSAAVGSTTKPCDPPPLRKIPIVFVPGVMGSRIEFPSLGEAWDPDSNWAMIHWVRISADRARRELQSTTQAQVMTASKGLSAEELRRGYAGLAAEYYLGFVRWLEGHVRPALREKLHIDSPVWAIGYDWRQSNKDSAAYVTEHVNDILKTEGASQIMLVSHSMGGIVTRYAMKKGLAGKVLGVVHVFQPVDGAVVLYRRFFTGALSDLDGGTGFATILGDTPEKFQTIVSGLPGPLQLLPTNNYRDAKGAAWLKFRREGVESSWSGDVYDLYTSAASPPAVFQFQVPAGGTPSPVAADLRANILGAKAFHAELGHYKHPKTKTVHGTGMMTDMALMFDPPTAPPPKPVSYGRGGTRMVVDWPFRGAHMERRSEGDATVPDTSGAALTPQEHVHGAEHSAACNSSAVRERVKAWIEELMA